MTDASINALYAQAEQAVHRQDFAAADTYCRQMLDERKDEPSALGILAHIALTRGEHDAADRHMKQAVRGAPRNARVRAQYGNLLVAMGRYREALLQHEKAIKLEPGLEVALGGKATVLERQDRYARARRALEPVVKQGSCSPVIIEPYLRILIHEGAYEEAITAGTACVQAHSKPSLTLRNVMFELARAQERSGDVDAAIATAGRANAMLAPAYEPMEDRWRMEGLMTTFTAERLAALPQASDPSALPVFIVGMPRSGSTLTERIIHTHPDAHGAGEISHITSLVNRLQGHLGSMHPYPKCVEEITQVAIDEVAGAHLTELANLAPGAIRVVNKNLGNFLHLGLLQLLFPAARIIHCRRNAVDMCLSCYMERLTPASAPYATDLRALGLYHRAYQQLMDHWRDVLDFEMLEVDYERLVADQEHTTREILAFCGLPWDETCLRFHETKRHDRTLSFDQVRRPLYDSSVGRAERFGAHLDPLREALAGQSEP